MTSVAISTVMWSGGRGYLYARRRGKQADRAHRSRLSTQSRYVKEAERVHNQSQLAEPAGGGESSSQWTKVAGRG